MYSAPLHCKKTSVMQIVKTILLYLLVAFYLFMGSAHLIAPAQYYAMMPSWLPMQTILIYLSGCIEILLAILLLFTKSRKNAAKAIIAMLIAFLILIHIPQSIGYYKTEHADFLLSIARIPMQFLLIGWAWLFTKNQ
jgi:uncharacterized membrane protein